MTPKHREDALKWARWYRARGYNPLPSCPGRRMPSWPGMSGYARERDEGIPPGLLAGPRWPNANIQVATGARWGLAVVDLDGAAGRATWRSWAAERGCPRTWAVLTPRGGMHLWFRVPPGSGPVPNATLWSGPGEHEAVELMGDGRLAIAPPSYKTIDGQRVPYRWATGRGPMDLAFPADLPPWVQGLVPAPAAPSPAPSRPGPRLVHRGRHFDHGDVLGVLDDDARLYLAVAWGLRLASARPNHAGWYRCHAIGREDRNPSASFHPGKGIYTEPHQGVYLRFFELAAALGAYATWADACDHLGERLLATSGKSAASPDFFC